MSAQPSLFVAPDVPPERKAPNLLEIQTREKLGMPLEWHWCEMHVLPEEGPRQAFSVTGVVPGIITRGPNKGKASFKHGTQKATAIISIEEDRVWCKAWHIKNDACEICHGEGRLLVSCGVSGNKYRACTACSETGKYQGAKP